MKILWLVLVLTWQLTLLGDQVWQAEELPAPFSVELKLSSPHIEKGQALTFTAEMNYPPSYELQDPFLLERFIEGSNPLDQAWIFTNKEEKILTQPHLKKLRLTASLVPLKEGFLNLSMRDIVFVSKNNDKPVTILTPLFSVEVSPPLTQPSAIAPPIALEPQFPLGLTPRNQEILNSPNRLEQEKKRIQHLMRAHTFPWLAVWVVAGGLGFVWMAYLIYRFWPKKYRVESKKPIFYKQKARTALQSLQHHPLETSAQVKHFYSSLARVLLTALQEGLHLPATSLTTQELKDVLRKQNQLRPELEAQIESALQETDQVRFANKAVSLEKVQHSYELVKHLVEQLP